MRKILKSFAKAPTVLVLALPLLSLSLSGCAGNERPATVPVKTSVPADLLSPVAAPSVPDPDNGASDIDVGVLIQEDGKALEACNAKLESISKLVDKY